MSLTTKDYWDRHYRPGKGRRPVVDPRRDYLADELLRLAGPHLPVPAPGRPARLLEMGCGNSQWMPFFAARGWQVTGLDYSADGCRMARENLEALGCAGEVSVRDFTAIGSEFNGRFEVVLSFGVVEHFESTAQAVGWFVRCVAPGGLLVTVVPNLTGGMGRWVKRIDAEIWRAHVPVDLATLSAAHRAHGLEIIAEGYLAFFALGMLNFSGRRGGRFWSRAAYALDRLHLLGRRCTGIRPQSASWSSYAAVVARRGAL